VKRRLYVRSSSVPFGMCDSVRLLYVGVNIPICSTTKRLLLGRVKEVRTKKSKVCGAQRLICKYIFSIP
jgi:hypothetical protein